MQPGIQLIHALSPKQSQQLCELYSVTWWTRERTPERVDKMLDHSDVVLGLVDDQANLVGFARVLSDFTYKALVLDVIVAESHQGKGLGAVLMDAVLKHPLLTNVAHFELYCLPEMEPFYHKWGFTSELGTLRFMRAGG